MTHLKIINKLRIPLSIEGSYRFYYISFDNKLKKLILIFFLLSNSIVAFNQINVLKLDQITTKDGLPQNSVQSILQDKYGLMWLSSFSGLYKFDGYEFTDYQPDPDNPRALVSGGVYNLLIDSLKNIYITFFDTTYVCKYNYENDDFERIPRYKLEKKLILKIVRPKKQPIKFFISGNIYWEYSNNLLTKKSLTTGKVLKFSIETPHNQSLTNEVITCLFIDKHENLWIGTENQGIYKVNTNSKSFFSYYDDDNEYNVPIKDIIRAINVDGFGNIWIGTFYNGIHIYNRKDNTLTSIRHNSKLPDNTLISDEIRSILCDKKGLIWIGTKEGLSCYNPKTNIFTNFNSTSKNPIPHNWVHTLLEDHNGVIWIGTFNGIARFDEKTKKFIAYDPKNILIHNQVDAIIEDSKNNIWVATQGGGVTCLKRKADPFQFNPVHYINSAGNKNSISSNRVFAIVEGPDGYIWIATEYGLNRLDPKTGDFLRFKQDSGLPNEMIMGLLFDSDGNLWISHKKGLSRMDTKKFTFRNYSEQDGLQSNEFSENTCFRNPFTGELFFGGSNGLNSFYSNQIDDNSTIPDIRFTGLEVLNQEVVPNKEVNGRVILTNPIYFTKEIILKYSDKSFSIKFAALHYANPKSNKYKFKLVGYNDNWISADPLVRFATYSNLPAGRYTFKVMASNSDGIWNREPAVLKIIIRPPWWNNWIAYIVYFLIVALIVYLTYDYIVSREEYKNQVRYERMKSKKIVELDEMKIQFFTNVSHEFRTPLSLIIDPLRKLNDGNVSQVQASYYYSVIMQNVQSLLGLVDQLLDFRKIEKGHIKLDIRQGDIVAFAKNIFETFKLKASQKQIKYNFYTSQPQLIANFDGDKLEKILNNLLSNAFKFTPDNGEISLEITSGKKSTSESEYTDYFIISVRDNGIGIPIKAQQKIFDRFYQAKTPGILQNRGTGIGLAYTKQLVDILKGKIYVKSSSGTGSVFSVKLPIGEVDNKELVKNKLQSSIIHEPLPLHHENEVETTDNLTIDDEEKLNILVIEDNIDVRTYLKHELSVKYNVIESSNASEGLAAALEHGPDIILSDIMMPGISGLELCKTIKADKRTSHIPFVLLTARQSDAYKKEGYEFGADAYITKPFNTSVLLAILNNLIESRKMLKEIFSNSPFIDIKKIAGNSADEGFLNTAITTIEDTISNADFNIDALSDILKMSRRQLTHKIKALTGQTVLDFIKTVRLNKGAKLLLSRDYSISEISYMLGYNVPANFSRSFSKQFGKTPSEYIDLAKE